MRIIDLQTNTVLDQPSDVAEKLLKAGTHTVSQGDSFFIQDAYSQEVKRVNGSELFKQLDLGNSLLPDALVKKTQEEEAYDGSNLRALALSALRTASWGTSDELLINSYGIKPEVISKLRKYNPVMDILGIGAGVAGSMAAAPLSAASKFLPVVAAGRAAAATEIAATPMIAKAIGSKLPTGLRDALIKYVPKAAGSAVEGAFYGTGSFVSEHALGNPEANGENLFADGAKFMLEGAGLGAGLSIAGSAAWKAIRKVGQGASYLAPYGAKLLTRVDVESSKSYLADPLKYDEALTAREISEKANGVFNFYKSQVDKGLLDLETLNSQLNYFSELAKDKQGSAKIAYDEIKTKVEEYTKSKLIEISETPIPRELTESFSKSKFDLKNKIGEQDATVNEILDSVSQDTPIIKSTDFLGKLKELRSQYFSESKTKKGEFLPKTIEEERSLSEINNYIERTQKWIDGGNEHLTLKEYRDYLKKVRKDVDFVGQSEYHADTANAILNLFQGYISKSLKDVAPSEFFPIMDELRSNTILLKELNAKLAGDDTVERYIFDAYKKNPSTLDKDDLVRQLDSATGNNVSEGIEQYNKIRESSKYATQEMKDRIASTSPYYKEMIEKGVEVEGLGTFTQAEESNLGRSILEGGENLPSLPSQAERASNYEFDILKKNKPYIDENLNQYLTSLTKVLEEVDSSGLLKKKRLKEDEIKVLKEKLKSISAFEDIDKATVQIGNKISGNQDKIKAYFGKISELSDTDFIELANNLRVKSAFDKTAINGSRNVNLYQSMFGSFGTPGQAGAGLGLIFGGAPGTIIGAGIGLMMDSYGPAITRSILRQFSKIRGPVMPSKVYEIMGQNAPEFKKDFNNVGLEVLKQTEKSNKKYIDLIKNAPKDLLKKKQMPLIPIILHDEQDFDDSKEQVQKWIDQSQVNTEKFMEDNEVFYHVAPETTISYLQTYQRAVEFMRGKVPRGTNDYFDEYEPNEGEKFRFTRYVDYIKDPSIVMKEIQSGFIPTEGIDVIKNVYPSMFQQLVDSVTNSVHDIGIKNIPINKRIEIKTKLGIDLAPNVTPQSFAQLQQNNVDSENIEKVNSKVQQRNQTDMARLTGKA
jgi:hypothetical protein